MGGRIHLEDEVAGGHQGPGIGHHLGADRGVGGVGEARGGLAPASTATSYPDWMSFLQDSGTSATRRSLGAVSAGTAMAASGLSIYVTGVPNLSGPARDARGKITNPGRAVMNPSCGPD